MRIRAAVLRVAASACLIAAWCAWPVGASALATADHPKPRAYRSDPSAYKPGPGPWPVKIIRRLVLKDQQRHRNVELTVRYPGAKGTRAHPSWPLVVFCQGNARGSSRDPFVDLTSHWASHGYVVVIPAQPDSTEPGAGRHVPRRVFDADQLDRLADVVFILDSLDQIEKRMDGFHGRKAAQIDRESIGVGGYSAGALTAQMAIGVKVRLSIETSEPELKAVGDPRFKAGIVISGQGTVSRMLTRDSWSDLGKPLLVMTGSRDVVATSRETPESREEPFLLAKPGQKYLVFIEGATHASFTGSTTAADSPDGSETDLRMVTATTASATLAFWDAYLANDEHGRDYLASDDLVRMAGGKVQLKRK